MSKKRAIPEAQARRQVGALLAERLVRNAVLGIQAEKLTPSRDLVVQMVRMIAAMRPVPASIDEARLATETVTRTISELESGEWDDRIEAMTKEHTS